MKKVVKIGSVGLGRLGYEHAKNIATSIPGAQLTAICDIDAQRVKDVAAEFDVAYTYTNFEEMCANPELDAIVIVSPSMFHADQIKIALDAGKHVFCDKPLDTTIAKCKVAEKAVEAHPDRVFMLGFMRRFDESYAEAKRRIAAGSGTTVQDVNQLIRQFDDMKKQMKMVMNQARGKKGRFRFPPMR